MDFEEVDFLLKRNWFLDEEFVDEILDEVSDDVYLKLFRNRKNYAKMIQYAICNADEDRFIDRSKIRMRVVNLTDDLVKKINEEKRIKQERHIHQEWLKKLETLEDRPFDYVDEQCDEAYMRLQDARKSLDEYMSRKTAKYVSPGARRNPTTDTEADRIRDHARTLENEFKSLQKEIETLDKQWIQEQEDEFKRKMRTL